MGDTGKAIISVTTIVSAVAAFTAIYDAGYLTPLNTIVWYTYTLPQIIWIGLIAAGPAVIAYGAWAGFRNPKDLLKDMSQELQQVGMSSGLQASLERQASQAAEGLGQSVLSKVAGAGQNALAQAGNLAQGALSQLRGAGSAAVAATPLGTVGQGAVAQAGALGQNALSQLESLGQNALSSAVSQAGAKLTSAVQVHATSGSSGFKAKLASFWQWVKGLWGNLSPAQQQQLEQAAEGAAQQVGQKVISAARVHATSGSSGFKAKLASFWQWVKGLWGNLSPAQQQQLEQAAEGAAQQVGQEVISAARVHAVKARRLCRPSLDAAAAEFPLPGQVAQAMSGEFAVFLTTRAKQLQVGNQTSASQYFAVGTARAASMRRTRNVTFHVRALLLVTLAIAIVAVAVLGAALRLW
jgi:uncharacterized protein (DUF1778 family)